MGVFSVCVVCNKHIQQASAGRRAGRQAVFCRLLLVAYVHNEGMKGRHKIPAEISSITKTSETRETAARFPSNTFFKFPVRRCEDRRYIGSKQSHDGINFFFFFFFGLRSSPI